MTQSSGNNQGVILELESEWILVRMGHCSRHGLRGAENLLGAGGLPALLVKHVCTHEPELHVAGAAGGCSWCVVWPKGLIPAVLGLNISTSWGTSPGAVMVSWSGRVKPGPECPWARWSSDAITSLSDCSAWCHHSSPLGTAWASVFCLVTAL